MHRSISHRIQWTLNINVCERIANDFVEVIDSTLKNNTNGRINEIKRWNDKTFAVTNLIEDTFNEENLIGRRLLFACIFRVQSLNSATGWEFCARVDNFSFETFESWVNTKWRPESSPCDCDELWQIVLRDPVTGAVNFWFHLWLAAGVESKRNESRIQLTLRSVNYCDWCCVCELLKARLNTWMNSKWSPGTRKNRAKLKVTTGLIVRKGTKTPHPHPQTDTKSGVKWHTQRKREKEIESACVCTPLCMRVCGQLCVHNLPHIQRFATFFSFGFCFVVRFVCCLFLSVKWIASAGSQLNWIQC